jgi:RNA polymerase sigma factor (sigma-70 family)
VEASALQQQTGIAGLPGRSPLLRLKTDEQLVTATRRGNQAAFETLVQRYQPRLLAFCRHMLGSKEDAEDVLQEVFAASYNALLADDRPINARPWLYRIARNRSLNHLRKPKSAGQDSMDIFERDNGTSTADTVHRREEFRQIVMDVGELPETQRSALLLREIDALSYEQIAEAMDTTVPSVKSLLVRARVSLAEASEARMLTCAEVRLELGEVAEGLTKTSPPVRRHLKGCKRCRCFRDELRNTSKALAAIYPVGPMVLIINKLGLAKLGFGGAAASGAAGGGSTAAGGAGRAASGAAVAAAGAGAAAGRAISAVTGTIAGKAAAGMAAAAIVTAGAVEVKSVTHSSVAPPQAAAISTHPVSPAATSEHHKRVPAKVVAAPKPEPVATVPVAPPVAEPVPTVAPVPVTPPETVQEDEGTVTLPTDGTPPPTTPGEDGTDPTTTTPPEPPPATTTPAPPPAAVVPPPPPPPAPAPPKSGQAAPSQPSSPPPAG